MRQKPVTIEVRRNGQHWAVLAEEQLIALTVYEKGAHTLEAVLRGLLRYTSRKLFRQALTDAMKAPKPVQATKEPKGAKAKAAPAKPKAKKAHAVRPPVKADQAPDAASGNAAPPSEASASEPAIIAAAPSN